MFARILLWCCLILDFYLLRIFFITGLISLLIIGLLSFFIFPDSVWEDFIFLGICSFLLCCPFYRHTIVRNNLSWSFVFRCSWLYLIFHLWFYWFVPPLFFSWWIWPNIYLSFIFLLFQKCLSPPFCFFLNSFSPSDFLSFMSEYNYGEYDMRVRLELNSNLGPPVI